MKITVITVCFNSEKTIESTIQSVLRQKNIELEYIIIDGKSDDKTLDIIKSYQKRFPNIIKYISEKDNGIYDAMNKGINLSTGDIIGILNSDDIYSVDNVLETVCNSFTENDVDACYGNILYVKEKNKFLVPYRYWKSGTARTFKFGWMPPHPAFFCKKEVYNKYGTFKLECGINADYELLLRFFEVFKLSSFWINKTFVYMRVGGASDNGINSRMIGYKDNKIAWKCNNITPLFFTLFFKRIRKIPQFIIAKFMKKKEI